MSRNACWTVRTVSAGPLARSLATGAAARRSAANAGHTRRPRRCALWRPGRVYPLPLRRLDRDGRKRRRCTGLSNRRDRRKDSGRRQHEPARTAPREHGMPKHWVFLTPAQGPALLNCVNRHGRSRTDRSDVREVRKWKAARGLAPESRCGNRRGRARTRAKPPVRTGDQTYRPARSAAYRPAPPCAGRCRPNSSRCEPDGARSGRSGPILGPHRRDR